MWSLISASMNPGGCFHQRWWNLLQVFLRRMGPTWRPSNLDLWSFKKFPQCVHKDGTCGWTTRRQHNQIKTIMWTQSAFKFLVWRNRRKAEKPGDETVNEDQQVAGLGVHSGDTGHNYIIIGGRSSTRRNQVCLLQIKNLQNKSSHL